MLGVGDEEVGFESNWGSVCRRRVERNEEEEEEALSWVSEEVYKFAACRF